MTLASGEDVSAECCQECNNASLPRGSPFANTETGISQGIHIACTEGADIPTYPRMLPGPGRMLREMTSGDISSSHRSIRRPGWAD